MLTQDYVRSLFEYVDGDLIWKITKSKRSKIGDKVGHLGSGGYKTVRIDYKSFKVHRIIFLYHHGYLPLEVDHIDGDKLNNKIQNLRPTTKTQNQWNSKTPITNKSGVKGVSWSKSNKKWHVSVGQNGKTFGRKHFEDLNEAKLYVENLRKKLHGDYARNV